jgi:hypothetical protein
MPRDAGEGGGVPVSTIAGAQAPASIKGKAISKERRPRGNRFSIAAA